MIQTFIGWFHFTKISKCYTTSMINIRRRQSHFEFTDLNIVIHEINLWIQSDTYIRLMSNCLIDNRKSKKQLSIKQLDINHLCRRSSVDVINLINKYWSEPIYKMTRYIIVMLLNFTFDKVFADIRINTINLSLSKYRNWSTIKFKYVIYLLGVED